MHTPRRIRSFVLREGRTTAAQQRALVELWPAYGIDSKGVLDLGTLFGRLAPRSLEIGFGAGEVIGHLAENHSERDYLGIEVHRPGVGRLLLALEEGQLSAGHGRALLAIENVTERLAIARRIARGGMTVRQVEKLASRGNRRRPTATRLAPDANTKAALDDLQREYGTRVLLHPKRGPKPGELIFEYYDDSDLTRLYDQLMRK